MKNNDSVKKAFQELTETYLANLDEKISSLKSEILTVLDTNPEAEKLTALYYQVHNLSGTSGTFGLEAIALYTNQIGNCLKALINGLKKPDPALKQEILSLFNQITLSLQKGSINEENTDH